MIYTIGYQRMGIDDLRAAVDRFSIDRVMDVRSNPYSSRPGFSRKELSEALGGSYEWRGDTLGGFGHIEDESLLKLASETGNILLMCMEEHPCDCHRHQRIALRLLDMGHDISHISGGVATLASHVQEECVERAEEESRQGSLF